MPNSSPLPASAVGKLPIQHFFGLDHTLQFLVLSLSCPKVPSISEAFCHSSSPVPLLKSSTSLSCVSMMKVNVYWLGSSNMSLSLRSSVEVFPQWPPSTLGVMCGLTVLLSLSFFGQTAYVSLLPIWPGRLGPGLKAQNMWPSQGFPTTIHQFKLISALDLNFSFQWEERRCWQLFQFLVVSLCDSSIHCEIRPQFGR